MNVELGKEITITCYYHRVTKFEDKDGYRVRLKVWETRPFKQDMKAIIIGIRSISNGITTWEGDDVGYMYTPKNHLRALLVSYSLRKNPKLVPFN